MRVWLCVVALVGCDRVFGIGDPYQDAAATIGDTPLLDMGMPVDTAAGSDATMPLAPLLAHFAFENGLENSADGTMASCTGICSFITPGHSGSALRLNGQGCVTFSVAGWQQAFTVAMWVDPSANTASRLFTRPASTSSMTEAWSLDGGSTQFIFWGNEASGNTPTYSTHGVLSGQWAHVAVTYDGDKKDIYVNGALDGGTGNDAIVTATDNTAYIACDLAETTKFDGQIDEVYVYGGALTPSEISALYHQ